MRTDTYAEILKVLANKIRLEILRALYHKGQLSFTNLESALGLNESDRGKFAYHLNLLKEHGLVEYDNVRAVYSLSKLGKMLFSHIRIIEEEVLKKRKGKLIFLYSAKEDSLEKLTKETLCYYLTKNVGLPKSLANKIYIYIREILEKLAEDEVISDDLLEDITYFYLLDQNYIDIYLDNLKIGYPLKSFTEKVSDTSTVSLTCSLAREYIFNRLVTDRCKVWIAKNIIFVNKICDILNSPISIDFPLNAFASLWKNHIFMRTFLSEIFRIIKSYKINIFFSDVESILPLMPNESKELFYKFLLITKYLLVDTDNIISVNMNLNHGKLEYILEFLKSLKRQYYGADFVSRSHHILIYTKGIRPIIDNRKLGRVTYDLVQDHWPVFFSDDGDCSLFCSEGKITIHSGSVAVVLPTLTLLSKNDETIIVSYLEEILGDIVVFFINHNKLVREKWKEMIKSLEIDIADIKFSYSIPIVGSHVSSVMINRSFNKNFIRNIYIQARNILEDVISNLPIREEIDVKVTAINQDLDIFKTIEFNMLRILSKKLPSHSEILRNFNVTGFLSHALRIPASERIRMEGQLQNETKVQSLLNIHISHPFVPFSDFKKLLSLMLEDNVRLATITQDYTVCEDCLSKEQGFLSMCPNCSSYRQSHYGKVLYRYIPLNSLNSLSKKEYISRIRYTYIS